MAQQNMFVAKEWLLEDPIASLEHVHKQLSVEDFSRPYALVFLKQVAITNVYVSNKLERTLPVGTSEKDAFNLLDTLFDDADEENAAPYAEWDAEGQMRESNKKTAAQLVQHLRSLKFLMRMVAKPLTVDVIIKTHEVLMAGALDADGTPIKNGIIRSHPCHAGTHVYPEGKPAVLLDSLHCIVDEYNDAAFAPSLVLPAARLFYDVITLHPFQNGNGRLCRLLFAFAMMQSGVPFPVALTTGHSRARSHYMKAILLARRGDFRELNTMALMSVESVVATFLENARCMAET